MDWMKRYLAPSLLAIVAVAQLVSVHTRGLSRWEGGGFGMYSELPPMTKHVVDDVSASRKPLTAGGRKQLVEATERFEVIPTERELDAVATVLRDDGVAPFRVEAWAESFDLETMAVTLKRIGQRSELGDAP